MSTYEITTSIGTTFDVEARSSSEAQQRARLSLMTAGHYNIKVTGIRKKGDAVS